MRAVIHDENEGHWLLRGLLSEFKEWKRQHKGHVSPEIVQFFRCQYWRTESWLKERGFVIPSAYETNQREEFLGEKNEV